MRPFIRKISVFLLLPILIFSAFYYTLNFIYNRHSASNSIFIWGDSQAYQGIDLDRLSKETGKKVFTGAHHGAGVYDFLVFSQQIPKGAVVLVSLSKLSQIRRKENDYNRTGISFYALRQLYVNNYSFTELKEIVFNNKLPSRNFVSETKLYDYSDSMEIGQPISNFEAYYQAIPSFLSDKQNLIKTGIQNLINKKCRIFFIEFPYHPLLAKVEDESPIKPEIEDFKSEVLSLFENAKIDSLKLNRKQNIFKDLTHLNGVGAAELSEYVGDNLNNESNTTLYIAY